MNKVHWLGAGLSSLPGIQRLANSGINITVLDGDQGRAERALSGTSGHRLGTAKSKRLAWPSPEHTVSPGDIVVSMLPGSWHQQIARFCIDKRAHFVSSSYISPAMAAMHSAAKRAGLCFINEVGLDPGLDHLFAHSLVDAYRKSAVCSNDNHLYFRSYCGGFPAMPNPFCYKFSWSPVGVLKALKSPAQWIEDAKFCTAEMPWKSIKPYTLQLYDGRQELFEAYPNRNSLPFVSDYRFDPDWQVDEFVRGTLRLDGWSDAWDCLFTELENLDISTADVRLGELSAGLMQQHAYAANEADRVVLCVELEARDSTGRALWHHSRTIDETGTGANSAMARLVSLPVSFAVESVMQEQLMPGVQSAPSDPVITSDWLSQLQAGGEFILETDHLASVYPSPCRATAGVGS